MGLLGWVFRILGVVVLAVLALGAYLWLTDAAVEATVTEAGPDYAVVTPRILPSYHYRVELDGTTASVVCKGYLVEFHLRSGDLIIYEDERKTDVVYAKQDGRETKNTAAAVRCGASRPPTGGGGIIGL